MSVFKEKMVALRHDLHRYPELEFNLGRTKKIVAKFLRDLGMEVYEGTGVVGILRSGLGNRAIGLRADMDALPIEEKASHDHVSKYSGAMHACGHDGHTTMLLSAAANLAKNCDFEGTVVFIFQSNEEHGLGAKAMIEEGVLKKFPVDEIYGMHNLPGRAVGEISTRFGQICASESLFEIKIVGKGGHASMPHTGVDTITVGAELVMSLQTIVSRKMAPSSGVVVSFTEFKSDGQRNVLSGEVVLKGDVRARRPDDREMVEKFMRQISHGIAEAHAVKFKMSFDTQFTEVINQKEPTQAVVRAARKIGLTTIDNCEPMSFSEDFAQFSSIVPGCFLMIGNGTIGVHGQSLHSATYDFNDDLLTIGAEFWASLVRDRLPLTD